MKNYEIYLDLDGVCIDFMASALEIQGYDPKTIFSKWKTTQPGELFPTLSIEKKTDGILHRQSVRDRNFLEGAKSL